MAVEALSAGRRSVPAALAAVAVALQIGYPLTSGASRDRVTVVIVVTFAAASAAHAVLTRGLRVGGAAVVLVAAGGWLAEVVGLHTGVPFGDYRYGSSLGVTLLGVPLVVPLAWTMVAWPAALVARRLVRTPLARVAVGAWALASWDLFLDPQLVAAGGWRWTAPSPHLPGVSSVPLTNYAGWLLVAAVLSAALQWLLRHDAGGPDAVPTALYLWTYAGSIVALAGFLDLAAAAAWGALGMGLVALPLSRSLRR
jgi:putative membrane protein